MKKFIISIAALFVISTPVFADSHEGGYEVPCIQCEEKEEAPKGLSDLKPELLKEEELAFDASKLSPEGFPKVPYPTAMIGQFMTFCVNIMNQRFYQERLPQQVAYASSAFICSCVMDSYRDKNQQAECQYEFTRKTAKEVPLFTDYLKTCTTLNNKNLSAFFPNNSRTQFNQ